MTTDIKKSQIIKSLNNLHLKGINSIDEGLVKNTRSLFSSSSAGAISINNTGLYQVIDSMIKQLLEIKNRDKVTRRIGVDVRADKYYITSVNRYSIKNREKQLYDVLRKAPAAEELSEFDLSNNIDGSVSSTNLKCQIVYNDDLKNGTDFFGTNNKDLDDNNKNNNFISLQTPTKYDSNDVRISGEFKFVLRNSLSGSDTNSSGKYYTNLTDNCTEFLVESDADATSENLKNAINSKSIFQADRNITSKTINVTQPNTDGIIIDNISFFTKGIQLPIENFTSLRYTQFIANTESESITANRGFLNSVNNRLAILTAGYDQNGLPVKKYSEDSLFDFFGKMTYEFIKLNYNHIGNEQNHPGSFKQLNSSNNISDHHLNSVKNKVTTGSNKNIKRLDFIKQLHNLKRNGSFGSINKSSISNTSPNTLSDIYKFIDNNLFTQTGTQIIPFRDDDATYHPVGLYQLIDNLIFQIQIFKNKIIKREKFYRDKLKESNPNEDFITLDNIYENNLKSKTSYCQTQGGLNSTLPKPSFIEIINNTDYTPGIEFKYSQDALFELCGRFLNELLKLNNGHSGFENIYPGFHSVVNLQATVSQHHLNSVIFS
jgi:hypothetical protein